MAHSQEHYRALLKAYFPNAGYLAAFAYGSAVFPQASEPDATALIDFLLVVEDEKALLDFHAQQYAQNSRLYPWLSPRLASYCYRNMVYFVPNAHAHGHNRPPIKYGVLTTETLLHDLWCWRSLYLAGRLHKPTLLIIPDAFEAYRAPFFQELSLAMQYNWDSALRVALLLGSRSMDEALLNVISISYRGDPRTSLAEHPDKCRQILQHQHPILLDIYRMRYERLKDQSSCALVGNLPYFLKKALIRESSVDAAIRSIVRPYACKQSIGGLLSTSPQTACAYVLRKMLKRFR